MVARIVPIICVHCKHSYEMHSHTQRCVDPRVNRKLTTKQKAAAAKKWDSGNETFWTPSVSIKQYKDTLVHTTPDIIFESNGIVIQGTVESLKALGEALLLKANHPHIVDCTLKGSFGSSIRIAVTDKMKGICQTI